MNKEGLPCMRVRQLKHRIIGGEEDRRHSCHLCERETLRDEEDLVLWHDDVGGVGSEASHAHHAITHGALAHTLSDCRDDTSKLEARSDGPAHIASS